MKRLSAFVILVLGTSGCSSFLYELQPHRLWRLNYQEPPGRTDGVLFSVDDPLPANNPTEAANSPNNAESQSPARPTNNQDCRP